MNTLDFFYAKFAYNHWANVQALESMRPAETPPPKSLKWMAHVIGAEWLWMARLKGDAPEGLEPAVTDFIHYIRQGFIKDGS